MPESVERESVFFRMDKRCMGMRIYLGPKETVHESTEKRARHIKR